MYKIGMYGGSFDPLHLGHVNDIIMGANQCEKLYVVLSNSKNLNEIDHRERLMWLKSITKDMENVVVFEIFDGEETKETYNWEHGVKQVKEKIGNKIDVVFSGDDYQGKNIWEMLYPESKIVYFKRKEISISSTKIRENPFRYYEYLPSIVQKYYIKKICVIGTESCGKTTLVRNLAKYFNTTHVEEAGRYICDEAGGIDNMQQYHYLDILLEHKRLEKEALKYANKVLFIDTDALITLYYYQLGFKEKNKKNSMFQNIAEGISFFSPYDLYLFLEPDVKWVQDGTRTYGEEKIREENNQLLKKLLLKNHIPYISITGNYQQRYEIAKEYVYKIMR